MQRSFLIALFLAPLVGFSAQAAQSAASWDGRVLDVTASSFISPDQMTRALRTADTIVLSEKHDTASIQSAQAEVLRAVVQDRHETARFVLGWEFLTASLQNPIQDAFERFKNGLITAEDFLKLSQGDAHNVTYIPILEAVRDFQGMLWAVNLSREEKAPVVQGGIAAADPALVPRGFAMGSAGYLERFTDVMEGGHATPAQIQNYYAAQCLTDDVIADQLVRAPGRSLRVLVVGSFHADYRDGVVARLQARDPGSQIRVVRFVDATDYSEDELRALPVDPKYGAIADFIVFRGEPSTK